MSYEINDRITSIRKDLSLSQTAFGERIGVSRSVIQNIDDHNTEPKPLLLKQICKEFNVDAHWLETGEGNNKFRPQTKNTVIQNFISEVMKDDEEAFRRRYVEMLANLDDDGWILLEKMLDTLYLSKKEKEQD